MEPEQLAPDYEALLATIGDTRRGRLLDVPSGPGMLARALAARGFGDIVAVDLLPASEFRGAAGIQYVRHDIETPLPFPDAAFDVVVSREGIEHLVCPFGFLREACRVLRPGGRLFLTTPNVMSVDGRIKFLLTGYFPKFRDMVNDRVGLMRQEHQGHISPIYFWQLVTFLERFGLCLETVATDTLVQQRLPHKRLLHSLAGYLIRCTTRRRGFDGLGIVSDTVLFGDSLIVQARKTESGAWLSSAAVA
jgi:SAM-dependent methyltransferase